MTAERDTNGTADDSETAGRRWQRRSRMSRLCRWHRVEAVLSPVVEPAETLEPAVEAVQDVEALPVASVEDAVVSGGACADAGADARPGARPRERRAEGDHRGAHLRVARSDHAEGARQAARQRAARGRGSVAGRPVRRLRRTGGACTWSRWPAGTRSPPVPSSTSGCGGSSTSGSRRSCRCRRSRRWPSSPTSSRSRRPRSPTSAAVNTVRRARHAARAPAHQDRRAASRWSGRPFLYATTREFLIRFGLRDIGDLPKVEDMADVLGFEPPEALLAPETTAMLPLDGPIGLGTGDESADGRRTDEEGRRGRARERGRGSE